MKALGSIFLIVAISQICLASVVHVPNDAPTIQAGVEAASMGDTVLVEAGTYFGEGNQEIDFNGKNILLKSESGFESTTIDCSGSGALAFYFHNGENNLAIVEGFTITGSVRWYCYGAGIWCDNSSPTIKNNLFFGNHCMGWLGAGCAVNGRGGAIYCTNSNAAIIGNIIRDNSASSLGGGIYCQNSDLNIIGNSFINNCLYGCAWGDTALGCALYCENSDPVITNNIFWADKTSPQVYDLLIHIDETSFPTITCNDIKSGWPGEGNFNADPLFCNIETHDYGIYDNSPCAPANNDCATLIGALDVGCEYYLCGDASGDGAVNVSDAVYIINYVFIGGDPPYPLEAGDCNCDGSCNVSDAVWIINYVFVGGNNPCDTDGDTIPDC